MAQRSFTDSLALLEAMGDSANVARSVYNLAAVELGRLRFDEAALLLARSLRHACELEDREDMAWSLLGLAAVEAHHERVDSGRQLLSTAESLLRGHGRVDEAVRGAAAQPHAPGARRLERRSGDRSAEPGGRRRARGRPRALTLT